MNVSLTGIQIEEEVNLCVHVVDQYGTLKESQIIQISLNGVPLFEQFTDNGIWAFQLPNAGTYTISTKESEDSMSVIFEGTFQAVEFVSVFLDYQFLTTKALVRTLYDSSDEFLYILAFAKKINAAFNIIIHYDDGSTHVYSHALMNLEKGLTYVQNIGFEVMDYNQFFPELSITHIEMMLDHETEKLTLIPATVNSDTVRSFYYFNSKGGMDSLICTGDHQPSMEIDSQEHVTELDDDALISDAEYLVITSQSRAPFVVHTGYKTSEEIKAIKDMILVNKVYELITEDGYKGFVPVIALDKKLALPSENSNVHALKLKFRPAFDENALDRIS